MNDWSFNGITKAGFESKGGSRPVAMMSFALNYYFHRYHVAGYHLINILIHITTGILVYFFFKYTLTILYHPASASLLSRHPHPSMSNAYLTAFFAALIWLVHPVQIQSVTYIVQRMNSMAAMFYIMALIFYIKGRLSKNKWKKGIFIAGCLFASLLAMGSKQTAYTIPFFIILYELFFFRDLKTTWLKRNFPYFILFTFLFFVMTFHFFGDDILNFNQANYKQLDFTLTQRVMTEFRVVVYYIVLLLFPHPSLLNLTHDFPLSYAMADPVTTLLSMMTITGLIGLAIYTAKKERIISFCILWFLGNLVIESSVIGLRLIFEHRMYLPSMFFCLLAVSLVFRFIKSNTVVIVILCMIVSVFSWRTVKRNRVWYSDVTLWEDCLKKSPGLPVLHNYLGVAYMHKGNNHEAVKHFQAFLKSRPDSVSCRSNLGTALMNLGKADKALGYFLEALEINPDQQGLNGNTGNALSALGKYKEAVTYYSEELKNHPHDAITQNNLGNALLRQGKTQDAVTCYQTAIRSEPEYAEAYNNLGVALIDTGKILDAISLFQKALNIRPNYNKAKKNLSKAIFLEKKTRKNTNQKDSGNVSPRTSHN